MTEKWEYGQHIEGAIWDSETKLWIKAISNSDYTPVEGVGIGSIFSVVVLPENKGQLSYHDIFSSEKLSATRERKYGGKELEFYEVDIQYEDDLVMGHFDELEYNSIYSQPQPGKIPEVNKVIQVTKLGVFRAVYDQSGLLMNLNTGLKGDSGVSISLSKKEITSIHDGGIVVDDLTNILNLKNEVIFNDRFYKIGKNDSETQVSISKFKYISQEGFKKIELASINVPSKINFENVKKVITDNGTEWLTLFNKIPAKYTLYR